MSNFFNISRSLAQTNPHGSVCGSEESGFNGVLHQGRTPSAGFGSPGSEYGSPAAESVEELRSQVFGGCETSRSVTEPLQGGPSESGRNKSDFGCSEDLVTSDTSSFLQKVSNTTYHCDFSPRRQKAGKSSSRPTRCQEARPSIQEQRGARGKVEDETDLGNQLRRRLVSNSNLFERQPAGAPGVSWAAEVTEEIVVNDVPTPPFPNRSLANRSGPTPPEQRVLGQKEFDRKLEAKRDIFSRGRSISLGAFRLPSRIFRSPKKRKKEKRRTGETDQSINIHQQQQQERSVRGELELVNVDQLINVDDLG